MMKDNIFKLKTKLQFLKNLITSNKNKKNKQYINAKNINNKTINKSPKNKNNRTIIIILMNENNANHYFLEELLLDNSIIRIINMNSKTISTIYKQNSLISKNKNKHTIKWFLIQVKVTRKIVYPHSGPRKRPHHKDNHLVINSLE